ncbi:nucleoside/nucleotide kinase family protein [Paenarthrobacter sp. YJN-5]|uniref:nucleoside/nucleotide kinase family protein n=1 Tax=Paenarthrobacter sp. YJN-5 TaxID=2735316 RepID=UPI0018776904|nr:nucleoside/nucleotide kinase family protein [Paenarthrobacter sp. YJN-5]QOT15245.1 nucleoside/nucleotide kinase family protein [Paenarthrobacter sp. YJN-5]
MNTAKDGNAVPAEGAEPISCTIEELIERARSLAEGSRRILGITGAPGAGKSTVAEAVAEALGTQAARVGMDAFHLANTVLAEHGSRDRKGAPDTFDSWGYANLLRRLKDNDEPVVYAPVFDRSLEESIGSAIPVERAVPLVITEGNYLLLDTDGWSACRELIDEVWYLEVAESERQVRLVRRHEAFGKPHDEAEAWALGSDQRNADVVDATRERADLVVALTGHPKPASYAQA